MTIDFDPELHQALRIKAAETGRTLSDLVNEAVRLSFLEDAEDLAAFEKRACEPDLAFEEWQIDQLVLEGLRSGTPETLSSEGWQKIRDEVWEKAADRLRYDGTVRSD